MLRVAGVAHGWRGAVGGGGRRAHAWRIAGKVRQGEASPARRWVAACGLGGVAHGPEVQKRRRAANGCELLTATTKRGRKAERIVRSLRQKNVAGAEGVEAVNRISNGRGENTPGLCCARIKKGRPWALGGGDCYLTGVPTVERVAVGKEVEDVDGTHRGGELVNAFARKALVGADGGC